MTIRYRFIRDASRRLCASFDVRADFATFDGVASFLVQRHNAKVVEKVTDHLDTRYWDLRIQGRLLTLHVDWAVLDLIAGEQDAEDLVRLLAPAVAAFLSGEPGEGGAANPPVMNDE